MRRSLEERNALVVQWLGLPVSTWRRWRRRLRCHMETCDAIAEGNLALIRAAELWDPAQGAFSSYATTAIERRWWCMARSRIRPTASLDDLWERGGFHPPAREVVVALDQQDELDCLLCHLNADDRAFLHEWFAGVSLKEQALRAGRSLKAVSAWRQNLVRRLRRLAGKEMTV